jgi:translation initiation factor IF-2
LKREEKGLSEGVVLEGYKNEEGLNAMTLIVKKGVLKVGSLLIIGGNYCKVKFMHDDKRANIN